MDLSRKVVLGVACLLQLFLIISLPTPPILITCPFLIGAQSKLKTRIRSSLGEWILTESNFPFIQGVFWFPKRPHKEPLDLLPWKNPEIWNSRQWPGEQHSVITSQFRLPSGLTTGMEVALCSPLLPSSLFGPRRRKIIHTCKPGANFEKTSLTREAIGKFIPPRLLCGPLGPSFRESGDGENRECAHHFWGMRCVCMKAPRALITCVWILERRAVQWTGGSELGTALDWDGLQSKGKPFPPHVWVLGKRLRPWGLPWRSQAHRLHMSPLYTICVLGGVCLCPHAHFCMPVYVAGKNQNGVFCHRDFRSCTSWAACATTSIFSFPISKVRMRKSTQFSYHEGYVKQNMKSARHRT